MKKIKPFKKEISHNIKARRLKLKLKQKFVASKLGVLSHCLSRIERGTYYISLPMLKSLCSILKCKSSDLLKF
jgi:DNA-binding XRE family transcriptional regulator